MTIKIITIVCVIIMIILAYLIIDNLVMWYYSYCTQEYIEEYGEEGLEELLNELNSDPENTEKQNSNYTVTIDLSKLGDIDDTEELCKALTTIIQNMVHDENSKRGK